MLTGPRVSKFTEGWALPIMSWGVAHYFKRDGLGPAIALCSGKSIRAGGLFEAGLRPRCKNCEKRLRIAERGLH